MFDLKKIFNKILKKIRIKQDINLNLEWSKTIEKNTSKFKMSYSRINK